MQNAEMQDAVMLNAAQNIYGSGAAPFGGAAPVIRRIFYMFYD